MKTCYAMLAAAVGVALTASAPAMAASMVNPNGTVTVEAGSPLSWTFNYNGISDNGGASIPGLTSQVQFNFLNRTGNTFNFSYTLRNTSTAPIDSARLTIFGFQTSGGGFTATTGAGNQFNVVSGGNQPNGLADINFCLKDSGNNNNCTGASDGLARGQNASGSFALTFTNPVNSLVLSQFSVRYQGIESTSLGIRDGSASGIGTPAVPEPATWAMMIAGFGLVGGVMRRRRASVAFA
jgi:hypothetical protein